MSGASPDRRVHALLVGIDTYQAGLPTLRGCKNDVARAAELLEPSLSEPPLILRDAEATREAVAAGIEHHLGAACAGDTVVFWFSGHGSLAPVPDQVAHLEPSGTSQTLVCADSRMPGVPDLQDYELAAMIDRIALDGVHVVVILDSCHSGGASRGETSGRGVPPAPEAPALDTLVDAVRFSTARDGGSDVLRRRRGNHVALTACQIHQTALEYRHRGAVRGAFTTALLDAASSQGPGATYRELMVAARCAIEDSVPDQHPLLYPAEHPVVDMEFLGGIGRRAGSAILMRHLHGRWEIDAGSCHGLSAPAADDPILVGVVGTPTQEARISRVGTVSSEVEPTGWEPDRSRPYSMVLTRVPMPVTTVTATGEPEFADRLANAIRTGGPGGGPSPHVRFAPGDDTAELRVEAPPGGAPVVFGQASTPLAPPVTAPDPLPTVLHELEHIARWRQVKRLVNARSALAGAVELEVVAAPSRMIVAPLDGPTMSPDADGVIRLRYAPKPPTVFLRLRNRSDRRLYCALLDLTDRFQIHPELFPGDYIEPGRVGAAVDGEKVHFSLPPGRAAVPGAQARDWLLLLVSDQEFSSSAFTLGRLGEPAPLRTRGAVGLNGVLERLGLTALHRDAGRASTVAHDWATSVVEVRTMVTAPPQAGLGTFLRPTPGMATSPPSD